MKLCSHFARASSCTMSVESKPGSPGGKLVSDFVASRNEKHPVFYIHQIIKTFCIIGWMKKCKKRFENKKAKEFNVLFDQKC